MTTKKRGQGEGSITQRQDGTWEAKVSLGWQTDADGNPKRIRKSIYGKTRREVAEKLKVALRDQQQGLPVAVERQTVAEFLDRWLADVAKPSVRPKTYHSYAQLVRLHIKPTLGRHQLSALAPQHVQQMMNDMLKSGLSPRTVQYVRAILRRALGYAVKWNLVARNVATLVEPPKSKRHEIAFLSPDQARTLLDAVKGDRLEALYSVALALGLRQGEALGLRWSDVDLDGKTITVRKALQRIGKSVQLVEPKTDGSRRTIPLPAAVASALRDHRKRQLEERLAAGPRWENWEGQELVFATPKGTPLDGRNLVRLFKAVLVRAELPDMRWHDLRHSCASLMLAKGVPAKVVQEWLGHSQITLTLDTYSHVIPSMKRDAADLLDEVFAGTG